MSAHRHPCRPTGHQRVLFVVELVPGDHVEVFAARALMTLFEDLRAEGIEPTRVGVEIADDVPPPH